MEKLKEVSLKNRIPSFDILRVFLVLLVVNLHRETMTGATQLFPGRFGWYAVPIFIILSFYLMSKFFTGETLPVNSLVTRLKRFLAPFLFWSVFGFAINPQAFNLKNIPFQLGTGGVVNVPLYYLLLMAIFTTFFWLLTHITLPKRIVVIAFTTICMFYLQYSGINYNFFSKVEPSIMYCYGRFVELFPYAAVGILIGLLATRKTSTHIFMLITALVGGLYFAVQSFLQPEGVDYSGLLFFFGGVFIFMYFFLIRHFRLPRNIEQIITTLGLYSFGVYVSHYLLLETVVRYIPGSREFNEAYPVGFLAVIMVVCYGVIIVVDKLTHERFSYLFK